MYMVQSLGLVCGVGLTARHISKAVSGNRKYLDYVLHLYEDLLQRLPRVESYSPQALQSPALRLALSDSFQLHSSLAIRCLKTFGRASKQGTMRNPPISPILSSAGC